jgi:ATP-dependent RNA helicase RhlE
VTFGSFGLPPAILKGIRAAGLTEATAVQSKAIPVALQGNDLIGIAQAGSGKTGAYLIPTLARLLDRSARLRGLILVPTRELASYVETRARDYARFTELKINVVFTGAPLQAQERMLREEPTNLLVATPGRLLELHARGCLDFADVEIMVLDEADRMVALGLAPDLRKLLKLLPETRQTLLFTLTVPPELNRLAKDALVEPVRVDMAPVTRPSAGITQAIYPVPRDLKPALLDEMLARGEVRSMLALTRSRTTADKVSKLLLRRGYAVTVLDEHLNQSEREQAMEDLRRGKVQILVASESSARSLDVAGIAHVVNYDVPQTPEDYVHRLGRAGRADPVGDAFTLMSPDEADEVAEIERFLGRAIPRVMLPDFDYEMHPTELKPVVSYTEERGARVAGGGVATAAQRIAAVPRVVSNGVGSSSAMPRRTPPPVRPAPTVKAAPKAAKVVARPAARGARPAAGSRTARSARPSRVARPASARTKKASVGTKKHKPVKAKGRK